MLRISRRNKFNARRTTLDGVKFDSQGEARRWAELQLLERAGEITSLQRQVPFALNVAGGGTVGKIVIDFCYFDKRTNQKVVEDFKGHPTPLALWKIKHFRLQYGIDIVITRSK